MKSNLLYRGLLIVILVNLLSCDFLDEQSQDEMRPTTIDDLKALMYGEAYPYSIDVDRYLDLLTDDLQSNGLAKDDYAPQHKNGSLFFTWNKEMFDGNESFPGEANSWKIYYEKIKGCNVIKSYIDEVSGSETEKKAVLGQVLFLRAYYYMKLVMIYGQDYNAPGVDPTTSLGVPLILSMEVTDNFPTRNSLFEVYSQIETDFLTAADLLKENYRPQSAFRVGAETVYAMLSRFYLYRNAEGDRKKLIDYASLAISEGPFLTTLSTFASKFKSKGIYDQDVSTEALWVFGNNTVYSTTYYVMANMFSSGLLPYTVSNDLLQLYDKGTLNSGLIDLRQQCYFFEHTSPVQKAGPNKIGTSQNIYGDRGIRIAEVYLNRAEACIRDYIETGNAQMMQQALDDLNALRITRMDTRTESYVPVDITDGEALLQFCLDERRRELCFEEGLRWFDIKRLGLDLQHEYIDAEGVRTTHSLPSNSLLHALPIPYLAIDRNYNLRQNPR